MAMIENEKVLEYGVSGAKDYLPGAEILPDEEELKQQEEEGMMMETVTCMMKVMMHDEINH